VTDLGLERVVRFLGAVPQHDLPKLYRSASVFVAPFVQAKNGDMDGLGLVSAEAAACGCPVVVSDIAAVRDIFGEGEATFVPPGDSMRLAEAILMVLRNPQDAHRPRRSDLISRFDWTSVASRYSELLRDVMSGQCI